LIWQPTFHNVLRHGPSMFVTSNKVYVKMNFFNEFMVHKRNLHPSRKMKATSKGVVTFFWNYTHAFEGVKFSRFLFLFIVGFYIWMHMRKCFGVEWTMVQMEHYCQNAKVIPLLQKNWRWWHCCGDHVYPRCFVCGVVVIGILNVDYE